jgi:hypothetical protein
MKTSILCTDRHNQSASWFKGSLPKAKIKELKGALDNPGMKKVALDSLGPTVYRVLNWEEKKGTIEIVLIEAVPLH